MEFAKQLKTLKAQNDIRKAQVESLTKPGAKQPAGVIGKGAAAKNDEDDYDDDFEKEYE